METKTPRFLTTAQVARLLYVSARTVDNMRHRGDLLADPLPGGRQWRFPTDQPALAAFLPRETVSA